MNTQKEIKNTQKSQCEWLFIFIIYADFGNDTVSANLLKKPTQRWTGRLFNSLLDLKINEKNQIALIHNTITTKGDRTRVGLLTKNARQRNDFKWIGDFHEKNLLQKPIELGNKIKIITSQYEANKYCIITCDHGSIFGINKTDDNVFASPNQYVKRNYDIYTDCVQLKCDFKNKNIKRVSQDRVEKSVSLTEEEIALIVNANNDPPALFEILTNDELADAILIGLDNRKADLVVMHNCNMQTIMTQFAIKRASRYLVAPLTTFAYPGYNFDFALNKVFEKDLTIVEFMAILCDSFVGNNSKYKENSKAINSWVVSSIDLEYIDTNFIQSINPFSDKLLHSLEIKFDTTVCGYLNDIVISLFPFDSDNSFVIFDLCSICSRLKHKLEELDTELNKTSELIASIDNLLKCLPDPLTAPIYIGTNIFQEYIATEKNSSPSSCNIFIPKTVEEIADENVQYFFTDIKNRTKVSFFQENDNWCKLIDKYIELLS